MSKLRYINDAIWAKLPVVDFRPRFFLESYIEKLRMFTPHFYQSRLLNIFSACSELTDFLTAYQENAKNRAYVISSMEEVAECWDRDSIAQEVLEEFSILRTELNIRSKGDDLSQNTQIRLKGLCRAVLARKPEYLTALLVQLEDAILGTVDLAQRERITSQIDRLTGLFTTYLLNQGYSPTYLFNRSEMFTREQNYNGRNFADQFRLVTSRLRDQQAMFEVYYGFHTARPALLLSITDEPNFQFLDAPPADITGAHLEKFKKNIDIKVVVKASLACTDYVTAALRTKEQLDRFLDATTALEFGDQMQVSAHCVTINRGQVTDIKTLNVDMLLAFISSESGSAMSHTNTSVRQVLKSLDASAKDQLGRSLRHLRLAKHSVSLEQKLLNLWIALESLFGNAGSSIIGNILDFVPQLYAVLGLTRRVSYLRELLVSNDVTVTPLIAAEICPGMPTFDSSVSDNQVFAILRNRKAAIELFDSLGSREHLKFKLMKIFRELENNSSIATRLERSEADVVRQLRRIYFLRNKIAHTGHFQGVRPQLVTHLLDYVAVAYRAIATATNKAPIGATYTISELLIASRMGVELLTTRAKSKDEVTVLEQITLQPVI